MERSHGVVGSSLAIKQSGSQLPFFWVDDFQPAHHDGK